MTEEIDPILYVLREEHRQAVSAVLTEIADYVRRQEARWNALLATAARKKDAAEMHELQLRLDVARNCRKRLSELRKQHDVQSLANRVLAHAHLRQRSDGDPTPEEIADHCERIRQQWTDDERRRRFAYKPQDVEFRATRFFQ